MTEYSIKATMQYPPVYQSCNVKGVGTGSLGGPRLPFRRGCPPCILHGHRRLGWRESGGVVAQPEEGEAVGGGASRW